MVVVASSATRGSSCNRICNSWAANALDSSRPHNCSSNRFRTNDSGSIVLRPTPTPALLQVGHWLAECQGSHLRPPASRCKRAPASPIREASACSGNSARVRNRALPSAPACPAFAHEAFRVRGEPRNRSLPAAANQNNPAARAATTLPIVSNLLPRDHRDPAKAAGRMHGGIGISGYADAALQSQGTNPRRKFLRRHRRAPIRSSIRPVSRTRSSAVSSTRGVKACATSSKAACADFSGRRRSLAQNCRGRGRSFDAGGTTSICPVFLFCCPADLKEVISSAKIAACNFVIPTSMPAARADSFSAITRPAGLALQNATLVRVAAARREQRLRRESQDCTCRQTSRSHSSLHARAC